MTPPRMIVMRMLMLVLPTVGDLAATPKLSDLAKEQSFAAIARAAVLAKLPVALAFRLPDDWVSPWQTLDAEAALELDVDSHPSPPPGHWV